MIGPESLAAWLVVGLAAAWMLWYVGGPLLRASSGRAGAVDGSVGAGAACSDSRDLSLAERELGTVLTALRELERDRELGLVTAEEYAPLRERHEARALLLYREVDEAAERRRLAVAAMVAEEKAAITSSDLAPAGADSLAVGAGSLPLGTGLRFGPGVVTPSPPSTLPLLNGQLPAGTAPPQDGGLAGTSPLRVPSGRGEGQGEGPVGGRAGAASAGVAGALTRPSATLSQGERGLSGGSRRLALGAAVVAVAFLAGVGALWYGGTAGRAAQRPIATVRAPDYHVLAFDPVSPGRVFLGTHAGLFVSSDRGQAWRPIPTAEGDVMAVVALPDGLLAAGHDVFLRSPDGASWQPFRTTLPGTDVHALAGSPAVPNRLYAAVVGQGMFRSDDAGRTWAQSGRIPPSITALAVVPDREGDLLYAATAQEGVLASRDGGRGWANASGFVNGALPTRQVTAIVYDGRSGDVAQSQAGAFNGALFVATDRGVFRSTDGGSAWARLGLDADVAALAIAPDDPRTLVAVDAGGRIYRSADRGVSW